MALPGISRYGKGLIEHAENDIQSDCPCVVIAISSITSGNMDLYWCIRIQAERCVRTCYDNAYIRTWMVLL